MKNRIILAAVLLGSQLAFASSALDELNPEDQAKVKNGEQVTNTQPGEGSAWPQIWVYQRVEATPEESMAMFSDQDRQSEYIPDLIYSKISKKIDKATCEVGYTIATHVFLHPKENYTMRNTVSAYEAGASYRVDWKLVSANQIRGSIGNARFEALGTGTLIAYYSFITPPSLANGQAGKAISGTQRSVKTIVERIETLRTSNQPLLQQEIATLRAAIAP